MPQNQHITKSHKELLINIEAFSEFLCFPARQAGFSDKNTFRSGLVIRVPKKSNK